MGRSKETEHDSLIFLFDTYSAKSSVFVFLFFYRDTQSTISYCDLSYQLPDDIVSIPCEKNKKAQTHFSDALNENTNPDSMP